MESKNAPKQDLLDPWLEKSRWLKGGHYRGGHHTNFILSSIPEEDAEAQLDDHEEELLWHPVPVDVGVKGVGAV